LTISSNSIKRSFQQTIKSQGSQDSFSSLNSIHFDKPPQVLYTIRIINAQNNTIYLLEPALTPDNSIKRYVFQNPSPLKTVQGVLQAIDSASSGSLIILNERLGKALLSERAFVKEFITLTNAAIDSHRTVDRQREGLVLHEQIADLKYVSGEYQEAEALYKSVSQMIKETNWIVLYNDVNKRLVRCQQRLGHYTEYVKLCIDMIYEMSRIDSPITSQIINDLTKTSRSMLKEKTIQNMALIFSPSISFKFNSRTQIYNNLQFKRMQSPQIGELNSQQQDED
ncbi:MAG: hypothetical protein EZS28_051785, partial [Streblomastix strix]